MITNSCLYITDEQRSIQFYTEKLNFQLSSNVTFSDGEKWWLLKIAGVDCGRLILIQKKQQKSCKSLTIINITDCVYEYCRLKKTNVQGLSEPVYSSIGLTIDFFDPDGNRIILLEERNYDELLSFQK